MPPQDPDTVPKRSTIVTYVVYLLILLIVSLAVARVASYDTEIAALNREIQRISSSLDEESDIAVLEHRDLRAEIAALQERVAALEARP